MKKNLNNSHKWGQLETKIYHHVTKITTGDQNRKHSPDICLVLYMNHHPCGCSMPQLAQLRHFAQIRKIPPQQQGINLIMESVEWDNYTNAKSFRNK